MAIGCPGNFPKSEHPKPKDMAGLAIPILLAGLLAPASGYPEQSRYTSLDQDCETSVYRGQPAEKCPVVGGWSVWVVAEQERTYLVLQSKGFSLNLRREMFSGNLGLFPDIHSPDNPTAEPRAEWRLSSGSVPRAFIVRVHGQDPGKSLQDDPHPYQSRLLVVRLGGNACVLGIVRTNEEARQLADGSGECSDSQGKPP